MAVVYEKVHILPIVVFVWFPITFILTYCIAVAVKDVVPVFPYISDTGTFSPESCIFGQLLNTGSILMAVVIYIRYRQVLEVCNLHGLKDPLLVVNSWSLWLGFTASFGVSVVGNFQETNIFSVHIIGAGMAFGLGTVYQILQTFVSLKLYPIIGTKGTNTVRLGLSTVCFLCGSLTFIFAGISLLEFDGDDMTKWTSANTGYKAHLCSAVAEWITAICTMGYILTFTVEFKQVRVTEPTIETLELQPSRKQNNQTPVERF